jgi:hypothetical protein
MNAKKLYAPVTLVLLIALTGSLVVAQGLEPQAPLGTRFTYQGRLTDAGGEPVNDTCDFEFSLWDAESGGDLFAGPVEVTGVVVSDGLFTARPDLGAVFDGTALWLEVGVKCSGDADYVTLDERQELTAAPYALNADLLDGQHADALAYWSLTGNWGTTPGTNFLGTTDNQALELKVNAARALRLEPANPPNLIGGSSDNSVTAGVYGATIGGGGTNYVTDDLGTVGGGGGNRAGNNNADVGDAWLATVGGGGWNIASSSYATIGGGKDNTASGEKATVGGGILNRAGQYGATVGGGDTNHADGPRTTVGGGWGNAASGENATVPGGHDNTAQGNDSFAAGRRAKANSQGCFVWADSTDADFTCSVADQFLVRASGGVSFNPGGTAAFLINGHTAWHAGNDGTGSGLDADLLDGHDTSYFAQASHNHWGESWSGSGTGLTLYGGSIGLSADGTDTGVAGSSTDGFGVSGGSKGGSGVSGSSTDGSGVSGDSTNGAGVAGKGDIGGYFTGSSASNPALYVEASGGGDLISAYDGGERRFRVSAKGDVFADGGYNCGQSIDDSAGDLDESEIQPCLKDDSPADFAEMLPAAPALEPGDVLVIGADGVLARSSQAYQPSVVGVYSSQPSYVGNSRYWDQDGYAPLAVSGVVRVKASAENGAIRPGDLLTTSATPGHAMRCVGVEACFGRTVGKALAGLDAAQGTGVILMLVMLQ